MMKKTVFLKNAAVLTASSLLLRLLGIVFKVWLASSIGAEGIGLYQLVFSLYVLVSTFATSGISTAVTRLVSNELALGSKNGVLKILARAVLLSLSIAFLSLAVLLPASNFISLHILGDQRTTASIKILSFSLPFMAVSSCIKGYFIARRQASPGATAGILEQLCRILIILLLLKRFAFAGLEAAVAAVFIGDALAEGLSCLYICLHFAVDKKHLSSLRGRARPNYKISREIARISLPITSGRYFNSALRTVENILVPRALSRFARSGDGISLFGMIKGMALPLLFFPSTLLNALSTLLIPEMSEAAARGNNRLVKSAVTAVLKVTLLISFVFSAIFFAAGDTLGRLIYKNEGVGFLLSALAPIVPLMYLDSVCDGILKGLDQQLFTFRTAISDSLIRLVAIFPVLSQLGINGFIGIMYFSNAYTCLLNVGRLLKISGVRLRASQMIFLPLCSAFSLSLLSSFLLSRLSGLSSLVYIILLCCFTIPLYILLLFAFGSVRKGDIRRFIR